ncbi:hypothetical protein [Halostella litorea]|uniref:hypothetical protein n=1 Tax=Halostella litorea TaxID=2528831 RepID=UPI0010928787|nr:hypothetical protein [Halostella litorea]
MIRRLVALTYDAYLWIPRRLYRQFGNWGLLISLFPMAMINVGLVAYAAVNIDPSRAGNLWSGPMLAVPIALTAVAVVLGRRREEHADRPAWTELHDPFDISVAIRDGSGDATASGSNVLRILGETDLDDTPDEGLERISKSLELGVVDPGNQERALHNAEYSPEEVASLCFDLVDRGHPPWRAIERFAFADPEVYEPYWDRLFGDPAEMKFHRLMALCHIARNDPERVPELVEALEPLVETGDTKRRKRVAVALAELSTVDDAPDEPLRKLGKGRDPDVREAAVAAKRFYDENSHGRFDLLDQSRAAGPGGTPHAGVVAPSTRTAPDDDDSGGRIGHSLYQCEDCGTYLWDDLDIVSTSSYSCSVCGHELDDQDGARKIYMYG